jgi:hypothetical protein
MVKRANAWRRALRGAACVVMGLVVGCEMFIETDEPDRKRDDGIECSGAVQCLSGFCVDSVCCASACDKECDACTAQAKTAGGDGVCGPRISCP